MRLEIDHVVFGVAGLSEAADHLASRYGLVSYPGGRHPGHGTANRIVPLGDSYLELVAVVDDEEAAASDFGSWVMNQAARIPTPHALCLRTDDIDQISSRLGLQPISMSRQTPAGPVLEWRLAGLERAISDGLPFFVEWAVPDEVLPGRISPGNEAKIDGVILSGDVVRIKRWIGEAARITVQTDIRPLQIVLDLGDRGVFLLPG